MFSFLNDATFDSFLVALIRPPVSDAIEYYSRSFFVFSMLCCLDSCIWTTAGLRTYIGVEMNAGFM